MALSEEQALQVLNLIIQEVGKNEISQTIKAIVYRDDYEDYVIVLDNLRYCEIREKVIRDYKELKNKDVLKEIVFKLKYAVQLEDWQLEDMGFKEIPGGEGKPQDLI